MTDYILQPLSRAARSSVVSIATSIEAPAPPYALATTQSMSSLEQRYSDPMARFCLRKVIEKNESSTEFVKAYIIVVPGIGTPHPEPGGQWNCTPDQSWLDKAASLMGTNTEVYSFEHGLSAQSLSSWGDVVRAGDGFLYCLTELRKNRRSQELPVLLIGHSLGGIMLKQGLATARQSSDSAAGLFTSLIGIVMLSVPHLTQENKPKWPNVIAILCSVSREIQPGLRNTTALETLEAVCWRYTNATLPMPVLSASEGRETNLKLSFPRRFPSRRRNSVLLDPELTKIDTAQEIPVVVDADHHSSCALSPTSVIFEHVEDLTQRGLRCFDELRQSSQSSDGWTDIGASTSTSPPAALSARPTAAQNQVSSVRSSTQHGSRPDQEHIRAINKALRSETNLPEVCNTTAESQKLLFYMIDEMPETKDFFARPDVLARLTRAFVSPDRDRRRGCPEGLTTFALCGIGGIGKTAVAAEFVRRCQRDKLFDVVLWVPAEDRDSLLKAFETASTQLGLSGVGELMRWLTKPSTSFQTGSEPNAHPATWLIVFDNAKKLDDLGSFWPMEGKGCLLITSRNPVIEHFRISHLRASLMHPDEESFLRLNSFTKEESIAFLEKLTPGAKRLNELDAARLIAGEFDGIPLALRQIANYMTRNGLGFREFEEEYREERTRHKLFRETTVSGQSQISACDLNIASVWNLDDLPRDAIMLFNLLAFLDPSQINQEILMKAKDKSVPNFPTTIQAYNAAKSALWQESLVDRTYENGLQVHTVVQATVRSNMNTPEWVNAFIAASALLLPCWPEDKRLKSGTWEKCDEIFRHASRLMERYESVEPNLRNELVTEDFLRLVIYSGWYDHDRGNSDGAEKMFRLAQDVSDRLGDRSISISISTEIHSSQGAIATETNDKARALYHSKELLRLTKEQFPGDPSPRRDVGMAVACNEVGIARAMNGEYEEATRSFEMSKMFASSHLNSGQENAYRVFSLASINLGMMYEMEGRLDDSIEVLKHAERMRTKEGHRDEDDDFIYGRLCHALGNTYESEGEDDLALKWHKKAFEHYRNTISEQHHRTADVAIRLADHCRRDSRLDEAGIYYDFAWNIFKEKKCYKPEQARCAHRQALLLIALDRQEEAEEKHRLAHSIYASVKRERRESVKSKVDQKDYDRLVTFWSA